MQFITKNGMQPSYECSVRTNGLSPMQIILRFHALTNTHSPQIFIQSIFIFADGKYTKLLLDFTIRWGAPPLK